MTCRFLPLLHIAIVLFPVCLYSQTADTGTVSGTVADESSGRPLQFVNVTLHAVTDSSMAKGVSTDSKGAFALGGVAPGDYFLRFSLIGYSQKATSRFVIDAQHKHANLGSVRLVPAEVDLEEVLVTAEKSVFSNSIDRKVYNVEQDLLSKSGSATDLLQNVPSVQVDIDGNVSLRGSQSVLLMLNGKTSPMLQRNSAEVLQEMPASSIEKIEVITNPSAKYKPDGTSGIINIVLKKNTQLGLNGSVATNAGNQDRYNANMRLNYNPGGLNLYGSYGIRRDTRNRINADTRREYDSAAPGVSFYDQLLNSFARPLSHIVMLGADYRAGMSDQFGISGNYFYNTFTRTEHSLTTLQDIARNPTEEFTRDRTDYEYEKEYGGKAYFEHDFQGEDHKIRLDYTLSRSPEQEDNHYENNYLLPAGVATFDNMLIENNTTRNELTLEYSDPVSDASSLEAGYAGEFNNNDFDFHGELYDPLVHQFKNDTTRTNHFIYDEAIHALYGTYKQSFGAFGVMGGLRVEQVYRTINLASRDSILTNSYFSLYPTLHLSLKLSKASELQLSYSRRTHRPEDEDLNPFPEYRDPRNISSGNPNLLPEYIHSLEFGWRFEHESFSVIPALFYRYTQNRFTTVTVPLNDSMYLTTRQNLSNDQAGGVEVVASANLNETLSAHWSGNAFASRIDATNLGFGGNKSTTTWSSTLTLNVNVMKESRLQVNANYNSSRLTPQGEYAPSYAVNAGIRQELLEGRLALVFTAADIFKTAKRQLDLNTSWVNQTVTNSRDARIVYFGVTYRFGSQAKQGSEEQIHYDDAL